MRLTWPDGFFVTYDHDTVGEMTAIHENGASIFASYAYDDLGRRGARYYSNGTSTLYGYDQISRLNHLTLSGGANATDILPSNDNPAGEIGQRSTSNDAYG